MNANEALGKQSQQRASLDQGLELLGKEQTVTFTKHTKVSLAPDASVFWVATSQTMVATGVLHLAVDRYQDEDQTIGANQVIFTSESRVDAFDQVNPTTMWIGSWPLGTSPDAPVLQIAFARRDAYFTEADLWHYSGFAVFPALSSQIVQTAADLPIGPIVSNSLPIWLTQTLVNAQTLQTVAVYPSFLVVDNLIPPYVSVHIDPDRTEALSAAPFIIPPGVQIPNTGTTPPADFYNFPGGQPYRDEVDLTLYGFTNQTAWQYWMQLLDASAAFGYWGLANSPAIQDAKRTQVEIAALAQKKTIKILANYNSGTADAIARRYILSAGISVTVVPFAA